jgi:hypothetical protein
MELLAVAMGTYCVQGEGNDLQEKAVLVWD